MRVKKEDSNKDYSDIHFGRLECDVSINSVIEDTVTIMAL